MKMFVLALLCVLSLPLRAQTPTYVNPVYEPLPGEVPPNYGSSAAEVAALFEPTLLANIVNNPDLDSMVSGMDDAMLGRLSTELAANAHPGPYGDFTVYVIANVFENRLSAANLHRAAAAFGPEYFMGVQYGWLYPARPDVTAAYNALGIPTPNPIGEWAASVGTPISTSGYNMTLYDIFLEYCTAGPVCNPALAAQQMARYGHVKVDGLKEDIYGVATLLALYYAIKSDPDTMTLLRNFWLQLQADTAACIADIDCAVDVAVLGVYLPPGVDVPDAAQTESPYVSPWDTWWPAPPPLDASDYYSVVYYQGN
jgi:hypothetical protein